MSFDKVVRATGSLILAVAGALAWTWYDWRLALVIFLAWWGADWERKGP